MTSEPSSTSSTEQWNKDKETAAKTGEREFASAKEQASGAADSIRDQAAQLASTARDKAYEGAEQGKSAAAGSIKDFAAAIRKASDELGERDQSMAADLVRQAANGLEQATGAIEGRSIQDITHSVAGFARRQPAAFLIGAALAGVALGRFARASGEHDHADSRQDAMSDYGSGQPYRSERSGPSSSYTGSSYGASRTSGTSSSTSGGVTRGTESSLGSQSATVPTSTYASSRPASFADRDLSSTSGTASGAGSATASTASDASKGAVGVTGPSSSALGASGTSGSTGTRGVNPTGSTGSTTPSSLGASTSTDHQKGDRT